MSTAKNLVTKLAIFILIPLIIGEIASRRLTAPFWFDQTAQSKTQNSIDFMFVGTSRVAAAIDEDVFKREMSSQLGRGVEAINFGRGYSTITQYYLGLRKIARQKPWVMQGCVVFMEAPGGLAFADTWADKWVWSEMPQYAAPYLTTNDLGRLWRESETNIDEKIYLSLATYSELVQKLPGLKLRVLAKGEQVSSGLLTKAGMLPPSSSDLSGNGGTRTDAVGIAVARRAALQVAADGLKNQQPLRHWEKSIFKDIVELITTHGGRVVLFRSPLSPAQAEPYQTALRRSDQELFSHQAAAWGVPILTVPCPTEDSDFPDGWHLRRSKAPQYTQALASAYLNTLEQARLNQR